MHKSIVTIENDEVGELIVQIDPFADIYSLKKGESITIGAHPESGLDVVFEISQKSQFTNIWLLNNTEYFLLVNGKELKSHELYVTKNT